MAEIPSGTERELNDWFGRMEARLGSSGGSAAGGTAADECHTDGPQHPISEKDWTERKAAFVSAVQRWCLKMRHAVNQFEKDVSQKGADSEEVTLALAVTKAVVGSFVPKQFELAKAVAEPAIVYVTKTIKAAQNGRVTLRDFCRTWDTGFDTFSSESGVHEKLFARFRKHMEAKCGADLTYEKIADEISYLEKQLPDRDAIRKALLKSWIDSSEDESVLVGDVWDDAAGYFHVRILRQGEDRWKLIKAYLDDTDEQHGVIKVLQMEYPNTKLEKLPFPMKVFLTHGINNRNLTIGEKGKGGALKFKEGMREVWDAWMSSSNGHPTTKDLSKDSIL